MAGDAPPRQNLELNSFWKNETRIRTFFLWDRIRCHFFNETQRRCRNYDWKTEIASKKKKPGANVTSFLADSRSVSSTPVWLRASFRRFRSLRASIPVPAAYAFVLLNLLLSSLIHDGFVYSSPIRPCAWFGSALLFIVVVTWFRSSSVAFLFVIAEFDFAAVKVLDPVEGWVQFTNSCVCSDDLKLDGGWRTEPELAWW